MNIESFHKGWIIGNFEPSIFKTTELDIGILDLKSGEIGDGHFHKQHVEYNIIIQGKAKIKDKIYSDGDIFIYNPFERSDVEYLSNTKLLVIKTPATKNDKYY